MLRRADALAEFHAHMVTDPRHGYSQPNRAGDGTTHNVTLSDGSVYTCRGGDKDCSSSIAEAVGQVLGIPEPFTYTGNEAAGLLATGLFKAVTDGTRKRGDILLRPGHTAIYQGSGKVSEFNRSERYTIDGKQGDQDSHESAINPDPNNWTHCFRYCGKEIETTNKGEAMGCILRIENESGHYYFDGQKAHPIHSPAELSALDRAYSLMTGKKELPRAVWPKKDVTDLLNVTKR